MDYDFVMQLMQNKFKLKEEEALYVSPEMKDGILKSGLIVSEGTLVAAKPVDSFVVDQEAGQSLSTEEAIIDDVVAEEVEQMDTERVVLELAENPLVDGEVEGESLGGSAEDKGTQELSVQRITENIPRTQLAQSTREDPSLQPLVRLAEASTTLQMVYSLEPG